MSVWVCACVYFQHKIVFSGHGRSGIKSWSLGNPCKQQCAADAARSIYCIRIKIPPANRIVDSGTKNGVILKIKRVSYNTGRSDSFATVRFDCETNDLNW